MVNNEEIKKKMREMEYLRRLLKRKAVYICICILGFMGLTLIKFTVWTFLLAILCLGGIYFFLDSRKEDRLKSLYKELIVTSSLETYYQEVRYDWRQGFPEDQIRKTYLIEEADIYTSTDYISASFGGVPFEQAYVTIQKKDIKLKDSPTETYFKGRIYMIYTPMYVSDYVHLTTKKFSHPGCLPDWMPSREIETEDPRFNQDFTIHVEIEPENILHQGQDAFYVLTPHYMERLRKIRSRYTRMVLSFIHNRLYIAVPQSVNLFDPGYDKPYVYNREIKRIEKETVIVRDVIKMLYLPNTDLRF